MTGPGAGPLDGLRVVDLSSGTVGPRATGVLADYGADVMWVEPIAGDPYRECLKVEYSVFNRGKQSVTLDGDLSKAGRDRLLELLSEADVFVVNWRPGTTAPLAIDFGELHSRFPPLVVCSITGFGPDGPYRDVPGYEPLVHAIVGTMGEQFGYREGPIFEALPFASIGSAHLAVIGILAALHARARDGVGRHVETSLLDGCLVYLAMLWGDTDLDEVETSASAQDLTPMGTSNRLICASFRCADDLYIGVHTGAVGAFGRLMKILGLDDRVRGSESGLDIGIALSPDEQTVLHSEIHKIFAREPRDIWEARLVDADICAIPVLEAGAMFDSPQARANGMVAEVDDPSLGRVEQIAPAITFSRTPASIRRPAPRVGEHRTETPGVATPQGRVWVGAASCDERPLLDGVRVLDLGVYYAGPCASRHLADLGADVIKVEPPGGDPLRGLPRGFRAAQAGKRALAANLRDPALHQARDGLIEWADIIHHNMRPEAAERLRIGYEDARRINPKIIYGYAPGWGSGGPFANRQSFEPMMSGYVGVSFEVAGQFNPPLYPAGNGDPGNALVGAIGMLMALLHRDRTGEGQHFEHSQLNATLTHMAHIVRREDGEVLGAMKLDPLQNGVSALERLYQTADGWICIVAVKDADIENLSKVLGVAILSNERFTSAALRRENDYVLSQLIGDAFSGKLTIPCCRELLHLGVPVAIPKPYNNQSFMRDPENQRTRRVAEVPHAALGHIREFDQYLRISNAAIRPYRLAPELGEHTDAILTELGYEADTIAALHTQGLVR